jgi:hypothetical protein
MKFLLLSLVACQMILQSNSKSGGRQKVPGVELREFYVLMRSSAATLCQSIYDKSWNCGTRCDKDSTLLQIFKSNQTDGAGFIVLNQNINALIVTFRGSQSAYSYYLDSNFILKSPTIFKTVSNAKIHAGFHDVYQSLQSTVQDALDKYAQQYQNSRIIFTGHSLGGAMATLAAIDYFGRTGNKQHVVTFGQPKVGNAEFADWTAGLNIEIKRIEAYRDLVPSLPPDWLFYKHTPQQYQIKYNETAKCIQDCPRKISLDFEAHITGYYSNATSINC